MESLRVRNSFGAWTRAKHIVPVFPAVTDMQQGIGAGSTLHMYVKKGHPRHYSGKLCTPAVIGQVWCSQSANEKEITGARAGHATVAACGYNSWPAVSFELAVML